MELLLQVSDQIHSLDNLKQGAIDFFQRFPGEVMATDGWKKAKQEHPNHQVWSLILETTEKIHGVSSGPKFLHYFAVHVIISLIKFFFSQSLCFQ